MLLYGDNYIDWEGRAACIGLLRFPVFSSVGLLRGVQMYRFFCISEWMRVCVELIHVAFYTHA